MGRVKEFVQTTRAFALLAPTLASVEIVNALLVLHSLDTQSLCLDYLLDLKPYSNVKFFMDYFRLAFLCMSHLLACDPSSMVIFEIFLTLKI